MQNKIHFLDEEDVDEQSESNVQSDEHIKKTHEDETVDETLDEGIFLVLFFVFTVFFFVFRVITRFHLEIRIFATEKIKTPAQMR